MITLTFTYQEAQTLLSLLGNNVVWAQANPFLMKIGEELRRHQPTNSGAEMPATVPTNSDNLAIKRSN
jgi:hypothetical protein